jgi:RNA-directed DNA polymerase
MGMDVVIVLRVWRGKLIIKPSANSIRKFKRKAFSIIKNNKAVKQEDLINQLNPVIRGWANFFKEACAKQVFAQMDDEIFHALWKWSKRRDDNKPRQWVKDSYFHRVGARDWIFACKTKSKLLQVFRMETVKIKRHTKVRNQANVYDKHWEIYFQKRKQKQLGKSGY